MRYLGTFATRSLGPSRTGVFARDDDAIMFFFCAAGAGIVLLLNILFYDKSKGD